MNNIIALTEKKHEARVDSRLMAEHLHIQHKNALALIDEYKPEFIELGRLAFETRKGDPLPHGGFAKSTRYALLNEDQSYFLLTLTRNTQRTKRLKVDLVKAFGRFRWDQQTAVDYLPFYHGLHDAIKALTEYARANGSSREAHVFHQMYNKLINKACGIEAGHRKNLAVNIRVNLTNATAAVIGTINRCIASKADYHDIYRQSKAAVESVTYTAISIESTVAHVDFKAGVSL